jgi:hypothetical protein
VDRNQLAALGEVRRPSIADLFIAIMTNNTSETQSSSFKHAMRQAELTK